MMQSAQPQLIETPPHPSASDVWRRREPLAYLSAITYRARGSRPRGLVCSEDLRTILEDELWKRGVRCMDLDEVNRMIPRTDDELWKFGQFKSAPTLMLTVDTASTQSRRVAAVMVSLRLADLARDPHDRNSLVMATYWDEVVTFFSGDNELALAERAAATELSSKFARDWRVAHAPRFPRTRSSDRAAVMSRPIHRGWVWAERLVPHLIRNLDGAVNVAYRHTHDWWFPPYLDEDGVYREGRWKDAARAFP